MHNEFTAIIEQDGPWYIASCLEIPGVNGQGHTPDEARESLAEAIREYLAAIDDLLQETPEAEVREVDVVV